MAIKMFCELCGKGMGSVNFKELKKLSQQKKEICNDCVKMEEDLKKYVEKQRGYISKKTEVLIKEMTDLMHERVIELIENRKSLEIEEIKKDLIEKQKEEIENGERNDRENKAD